MPEAENARSSIELVSDDALLPIFEHALPAFKYGTTKDYHARLANLKLVCRHWKTLIDETATFHSKVPVPAPLDTLRSLLKLSKNASLQLVAELSEKAGFTQETENALLEQSSRWQSLWLEISSWCLPTERLFSEKTPLTLLQAISLTVGDSNDARALVEGLSQNLVPNLHTLRLLGAVDVSFGVKAGAFKSLTSLSLSGGGESPRASDVVTLMQLNPDLVQLELRTSHPREAADQENIPHISLHRLSSLTLEIPGFPLNEFLQHLHLAPCQQIRITVESPPTWILDGSPDSPNTSYFGARLVELLSRLPWVSVGYHRRGWCMSTLFMQEPEFRLDLAYSEEHGPLSYIGSLIMAANIPRVALESLQANLSPAQVALLLQLPNIYSITTNPEKNPYLWRCILTGFEGSQRRLKLRHMTVKYQPTSNASERPTTTLRRLFETVNLAAETVKGIQAHNITFHGRWSSLDDFDDISEDLQQLVKKFFGCKVTFTGSYTAPAVEIAVPGGTSVEDID